MSTGQTAVGQANLYLPTHFLQRMGENVQGFYEMLIRPQSVLKLLGIGLPNDFSFAVSYAQAKLARISEIRDFGYVQDNNTLKIFAYIDKPNEQAEKEVYSVYSDLLDLLPNTDVDVRIVELYGRSKEEMQLLGL